MNRSIFWRLVWKEYRLQRALWIAIVVLTLLLQGIMVWTVTDPTERGYCLFGSALVLTACYALGCGAVLFAAERETGTFEFQRAIPVSSWQVFAAKVSFALGSMAALVLVLLVSAAVLSRWRLYEAPAQLWGIFGLGALEVLAWGIFFSLQSARPLLTAILGVTAASTAVHLIAWSVAPRIESVDYAPTVPYRVVALLLVALADLSLGLRWLGPKREVSLADRLARWRRRAADATVAGPIARRAPRGMMFGRLVWHQWRQSRRMMAALALLAVVFVAITVWHEGDTVGWSQGLGLDWFDVTAILASLLAALTGSCVFLGDQSGHRFRFLAEHAARPGYVWLSRQLVWLAAVVLLLIAAAALVVLLIERNNLQELLHTEWGLLVSDKRGLVGLIVWMLLAYTAGQLCSLFLRSGILAAVFGIMLGTALCGWAWLMGFLDINWLSSVAPIPIVLLVATRVRTGDWMLQRNRFWGWLRVALVLAVPAVAIMAAIPAARLSGLPPVDPAFWEWVAVRDWTDEERATEAMFDRASGLYRDPVEFLPAEQLASLFREPDAGFLPTPPERAWVNANRECIAATLDATRRPVSDDPRPIRWEDRVHVPVNYEGLPRLLGVAARVAQADGKLDEAMEYHLAALRLSRYNAVYHEGYLDVPGFDYSRLCAWVAAPGQTSQRVATMLREVTKLTEHPPSRTPDIVADCQHVRDVIDGDSRAVAVAGLSAREVFAITLWNHWLPWERQRALRLLAHGTIALTDYCRALEQQVAESGVIHAAQGPRDGFLSDSAGRPLRALALNHHLAFPRFWLTPEVAIREATWRRVVRLMLAVEAWRLDKGRFPESLDVLVGPYLERMPLDPRTGEPFGYFPEGLGAPARPFSGEGRRIAANQPVLIGEWFQSGSPFPTWDGSGTLYAIERPGRNEWWCIEGVFLLPIPKEKAPAGGSSAPHK